MSRRMSCALTVDAVLARTKTVTRRRSDTWLTLCRGDHLCRNPGCYNPTHLEAVTNRENMMRGKSWVADIVRTGLCMRGHPLAGENLILRPNGWRQCRTCINVARRRRRAELRAGAAYVRGPRARRLAK